MATYPGLTSHPFPTCFACGTGREEGDGLRIFPGPVGRPIGRARTRIAATWTPHPSVAEDWHTYVDDVRHASLAVTWAALDCVGGWAGDLEERLMVLGRMTARVDALPGRRRGARRRRPGPRARTAARPSPPPPSTTPTAGSSAAAEHVWIAVDPATFR